MRAQNPLSAHQPACDHRRVLAAGLCQHKINSSSFCLTIQEVADCLLIQLSQCFKSVLGFVLLTASRLFLNNAFVLLTASRLLLNDAFVFLKASRLLLSDAFRLLLKAFHSHFVNLGVKVCILHNTNNHNQWIFHYCFFTQYFSSYFNSHRCDSCVFFNYLKSDFFIKIVYNLCFFSFFKLAANDRGYGHPAVCGSFTVAKRNSECGRKTCGMHVSQQVNIGVC